MIKRILLLLCLVFNYNIALAALEGEQEQEVSEEETGEMPAEMEEDDSGNIKASESEVIETNNIIKDEDESYNGFKRYAVLQAINKITARNTKIKTNVNSVVNFGNLTLYVRSCWAAPLEEKPENKVLLQIKDQKPGEKSEEMAFSGWMLSSSPGLSPLEHPVYDIELLECVN